MVTIEEFKNNITKKSRLLGLDLGSKRIGVAICDDTQSVATPFTTINKENNTKLIEQLKLIVEENNIKGIVVGNPINMDGSRGPSAQSANDFAKYLSNNISIPVTMWDERLSSEGAFNLLGNLNVNVSKKVEKLDQNSATFILQGAIDYLRR